MECYTNGLRTKFQQALIDHPVPQLHANPYQLSSRSRASKSLKRAKQSQEWIRYVAAEFWIRAHWGFHVRRLTQRQPSLAEFRPFRFFNDMPTVLTKQAEHNFTAFKRPLTTTLCTACMTLWEDLVISRFVCPVAHFIFLIQASTPSDSDQLKARCGPASAAGTRGTRDMAV